MSLTDLEQGQVTCCPDIVPDLAPMNPNGLARSVLGLGWTGLSAERPVVLAGTRGTSRNGRRLGAEEQLSPSEQLLYADAVGSDGKLIIGDTRLGKYRPTARNPVRAFVI